MFLALFACTGAPDGSVDSDDGLVGCAVDVHEHFDISLDFSTGIGTLHDDMAQVGVTHALIQTPPVSGLSLVGARYTFETDMTPSLQDAAAHNADLFLVAGGGILNPWIDQTDPGDAGPEMRTAFADEAGRILDAGAAGFGELALLHLSIDNTHPFIEIDPGHPLMLELARVAGRRGVPLDIHLELVDGADLAVADLPSACFETESDGGNNPDTLTENRSAFETLLEENASAADTEADAMVVWSHVGWDNTGHMDADTVGELMAAHDNLYPSLKMLTSVGPCQVLANRPIDPATGELRDEWLALIETYPDRFVLGGDEFFGEPGGSVNGSASLGGTWEVIEQLPDTLAEKIACSNPIRMWDLAL